MASASSSSKSPKYFAFVSYAHKDGRVATSLSRYLETFRVPVRLGGKHTELPKRMFPVFRDRDELSASTDLGESIKAALASSGALIVLCSPDAARSKWVAEEIRTFRQFRNGHRIFPVLLEGEASDALPEPLREHPQDSPVTDLRRGTKNVRDARLGLVAALLGLSFDALKRSEQERSRRAWLRAAACLCVVALGAAAYESDQPHVTVYSVPGGASMITAGPDGALWFTLESGEQKIGRISPNGRVIEYPVQVSSAPRDISAGPDGALWFTESGRGNDGDLAIGRITTGGLASELRLGRYTTTIISGGKGSLWFTDLVTEGIGQFRLPTPSRDGEVLEYPIGIPGPGLTLGPDGAVWFTEVGTHDSVVGGGSRIGRITAGGHITLFSLPTSNNPGGITLGHDGALWFTDFGVNRIGRITTNGHITEYRIPTSDAWLGAIATGSDGALWFSEADGKKIGRITTSGHTTEYPVPGGPGKFSHLVLGPDGAMWFVTSDGNIGRITAGHWFFGI